MNIETANTPLVLIAPAWKKWGTATTVKTAVIILHSAHDEVVPIESSRELLARSGLPEDHLLVVGENHRMVDETAFGALLEAVERVGRKTHCDDCFKHG